MGMWWRNVRSSEPLSPTTAGLNYHLWYYNSMVWDSTTWEGVKALKSPMDMWNYQEIIVERQPSLVIEFGTRFGGATLFFASVLRRLGGKRKVLTVDIDRATIHPRVFEDPLVEVLTASTVSRDVADRIASVRQELRGPAFAILDSDHARDHVLGEMLLLRPLLVSGDYVVVEDSNVNGHPVVPDFGPGPFEAVNAYFERYPDDYAHDVKREEKFGFTFAPSGFLIRR